MFGRCSNIKKLIVIGVVVLAAVFLTSEVAEAQRDRSSAKLSISSNAPRIIEGKFEKWFVERPDGDAESDETPVLSVEIIVEDPNDDFNIAQLFLLDTLELGIRRDQVGFPLSCEATGVNGDDGEQHRCSLSIGISDSIPSDEYLVVVVAIDDAGNISNRWPFFSIMHMVD